MNYILKLLPKEGTTICYITINDDNDGGDVDRCTLTLWRMW